MVMELRKWSYREGVETWTNRDFPVLKALVELADDLDLIQADDVVRRVDLSRADVVKAMRALANNTPSYFVGFQYGNAENPLLQSVTGYARRAVDVWPNPETVTVALLEALQRQIDSMPEDEEKTKAKRALDWLRTTGEAVLIHVLTEIIVGGGSR